MLKKGKSLLSLGINEYVWNKDDIKEILEELLEMKVGVLGGDVYKLERENIKMTYDSWYINDDNSETFYQISILKALKYIENYEKNNCGDFLYSIVI